MTGEPLVRKGSGNSEWVRYLQQYLKYNGCDPGEEDGVFGDRTEAAVRQYQQANGMLVDGIAGLQTWGGLVDNMSVAPGVPGAATPSADGGGGAQGGTEPIRVKTSPLFVPQPTDTSCWAASIGMLVGESAEAVVEKVGLDINGSYGWDQIEPAASQWGLSQLAPACAMPELLASWLSSCGPLWVVEIGAPYHAVVVAEIEGDGSIDGTLVMIYNPWPPGGGAVEQKTFRDFEADFELGSGSRAAILHR